MQDHHSPTTFAPPLIPLAGPMNRPVQRQPWLKDIIFGLLRDLLGRRTRKASEAPIVPI